MSTRISARLFEVIFPAVCLAACGFGQVPGREFAPTLPQAQRAHTRPSTKELGCPLPAGDPFCPLNAAFRDAYAERRAATLAASGPVLVQYGDRLVLLRNGERTEALVTNDLYHELKTIAHVPLSVYLLLADVSGALEEPRLRELRSYQGLIDQAAAGIDLRFKNPARRDRAARILSRSRSLLEQVVREKRMAAERLREFVQEQRDDVLANVKDAAREQVWMLHAQVTAWASRMTPEERDRLRVVIGTVHMARTGNLALQYFAAWLREPSAGRFADEQVSVSSRIVITENVFDTDRLLGIVGTHLVDRAAATVFFDDALRLDRDILGDGAEEVIRELFGETLVTSPTGR